MHEIMLQNITSQDRRRRDLVIQEHLAQAGVCADSEKHFTYIIRSRRHLLNPFNLKLVKFGKAVTQPTKQRHFYITRRYDTKKSKAEFTFTTSSDLYVVAGLDVFYVTLIYSVRLDIKNEP